jgi:hypothetical protein
MQELEKYSFPDDAQPDAQVCLDLGLNQPLDTITLKPPQLLVYHYGLSHDRFVLSFDKGMGKTIAYLAVLYHTRGEKTIIVCSKNAFLAQRREILRHLEEWKLSWTFIEGQKPQRKKGWQKECAVYICTPSTLLADMGFHARSTGRIAPSWVNNFSTNMAFDEWHKYLRSHKSGIFKMLKKEFPNRRMIFSSGSAAGKGAHSMWAVLHLCNPTKFPAYWPYVQRWCYITESYFGKKVSGCSNVPQWRKFVSTNVFHRRKDLKDYPLKTRQALEVRMEPWQKRTHDSLRDELYAFLPDGEIFATSTTLEAYTRIRQFMVCPKFLSPDYGWGAGLEGILADAQDSELSHFVISTPFRAPIPLIQKFFRENDVPSEVLMGGLGLTADQMEARIEAWTRNGGVMIQTIQFAESYELPAAQNMYMLGYLHDPEQNAQAEDRIHRDKRVTPWPVNIYYVKHLFSYDEDIVEAMSETADHAHDMMHRPMKDIFK